MTEFPGVDFHKFVHTRLAEKNFMIHPLTERLIRNRLRDFSEFVNSVRREYSGMYGWEEEDNSYFLNPMTDKWKLSFFITDEKDNICFVNFSSVYGKIIHNHCTYAKPDKRNLGFAKLHMIKLCQTGIDLGFTEQEGYWPKNNNRSIILFLKMGWQIDSIRNNTDLMMKADLYHVRNRTYNLLAEENE